MMKRVHLKFQQEYQYVNISMLQMQKKFISHKINRGQKNFNKILVWQALNETGNVSEPLVCDVSKSNFCMDTDSVSNLKMQMFLRTEDRLGHYVKKITPKRTKMSLELSM